MSACRAFARMAPHDRARGTATGFVTRCSATFSSPPACAWKRHPTCSQLRFRFATPARNVSGGSSFRRHLQRVTGGEACCCRAVCLFAPGAGAPLVPDRRHRRVEPGAQDAAQPQAAVPRGHQLHHRAGHHRLRAPVDRGGDPHAARGDRAVVRRLHRLGGRARRIARRSGCCGNCRGARSAGLGCGGCEHASSGSWDKRQPLACCTAAPQCGGASPSTPSSRTEAINRPSRMCSRRSSLARRWRMRRTTVSWRKRNHSDRMVFRSRARSERTSTTPSGPSSSWSSSTV